MISLQQMQKIIFRTAFEHGWWPLKPRPEGEPSNVRIAAVPENIDLSQVNIPEKLALMHSEISEALEFYRTDFEGSPVIIYTGERKDKPDGFWIELADCMIRILDLAEAYGVDMETVMRLKMEYNETRPYRHGNKKC